MSKKEAQQFLRFDRVVRIQHWLMALSFAVLAFTGLAQKYSGLSVSVQFISLLGGIEAVRIIHRIAAISLMVVVVIHIGVVGLQIFVQRVLPKMLPNWKDFLDALKSLKFNLGVAKEKPSFGRYSFEEKFEYWALVWGLAIMILTGFMLWNPIATTQFLPGQFIPAAKSAHGNEALLALLAILIWHLYHVLVRHFNRSMFTGAISREEMVEFHPLELAEIESSTKPPRDPEIIIAKRRRRFIPVFAAICSLLLFGIYEFVTFEKTALDTISPPVQVTPFSPLPTEPSPTLGQTQIIPPLELMWPVSAHTSAASFRYWDSQAMVGQGCSTCHSSDGLPSFLSSGSAMPQPISSGLSCTTCHNDTMQFTVFDVSPVVFPSGASSEGTSSESNLCTTCHVGVKSGTEISIVVASLENDTVNPSLEFVDVHGAAPGATMYGSEANGGYQYENLSYFGLRNHSSQFGSCTDCHDPHQLDVNRDICANCHSGYDPSQEPSAIRFSRTDYDGDGNINEGIAEEIKTLQDALLIALQNYASETTGSDIIYNSQVAPYFFIDLNQNGADEEEEINATNRFASWTPRLLIAAYNYHYTLIDSGGFVHNPKYIIQLLYDSLENLEVDVSNLVRP